MEQTKLAIVTGNIWAGRKYHSIKLGKQVKILAFDFHGHHNKYLCQRTGFIKWFTPAQWVISTDLSFL